MSSVAVQSKGRNRKGDIIETGKGPWSSPIVPVRKLDGNIRLCIDFRKLNSVTISDPFCMPLIEDLLDQVGTSKVLSKRDLSKGFYQILVRLEDQDKTAFVTTFGKYRFKRMPFGLKNGPSTFQRAILNVLEGQEEYSTVYIDDILIFLLSWEDHLIHITAILEVLKRHGLTAKPSKCVWGARTLEYLGHIVGDGKVAVPEARVQAIRDF